MSDSTSRGKTFNGIQCKICTSTLRYVSNSRCVSCLKAFSKSSKFKAYLQQYRQSVRGKEVRKRYRQSDHGKEVSLDSVRRCNKKYRQSSKGKLTQQRNTASMKRKEYRKIYLKKYETTEKGKAVRAVSSQKNRAKRRLAEGSYTGQEWLSLKEQYGNICLCCRKHESEIDRPLEQDHVIPISKGGSNWITNIQPLCRRCNGMTGKGTKIIDYRNQI